MKPYAYRFLFFVGGLAIGILPHVLFSDPAERSPVLRQTVVQRHADEGGGCGGCDLAPSNAEGLAADKVTHPYKVLAQPKALYTDEARSNGLEGSVILKITLLASGEIGSITVVKDLPHGLTEKAMEAARKIQFEPKKVNGIPQSVIITREYTFTIY